MKLKGMREEIFADENEAKATAELCLLGKQYARAFNIYASIDDKAGMEKTVIRLIQEIKSLVTANEGFACDESKPMDIILWCMHTAAGEFTAEICAKYLSDPKDVQLLCQLAKQAPNKASAIKIAAAFRVIEELKKKGEILESFEFLMRLCETGSVPDNLASIKSLVMSRKISVLNQLRYTKILNDRELILSALKKAYWGWRNKDVWACFYELKIIGAREEITSLARWIEKKKSRMRNKATVYIKIKKYLNEPFSLDQVVGIVTEKPKRKLLYDMREILENCSVSDNGKLKFALAFEKMEIFDEAARLYAELRDWENLNWTVWKVCTSQDDDMQKHLTYALKSEALPHLLSHNRAVLIYSALHLNPMNCLKWADELNAEELADLLQALVKNGHIEERLFEKLGIPLTAEYYKEALMHVGCGSEQAKKYIQKIMDISRKASYSG